MVTQAPYAVNWIATTTGNQTLKAVATDNDSNTSESAVSVTVSDQDLVVSLTSPTSGQTVGLGKPVNIAADATSLTNNVAKVEFVVNGAVVATDTTEPLLTVGRQVRLVTIPLPRKRLTQQERA